MSILAVLWIILFLAPGFCHGQSSLFDPKLDEFRKATVEWDRRLGPERRVVDVVCLVPDVPTFLHAIKAWDNQHYFPILIEDVEYTLKFIRAFRPSRVIRFPHQGKPGGKELIWSNAIAAVAETWDGPANDSVTILRGDLVPHTLGSTPPGVVLSHPGSQSLAGAVALAAGRFQPLWNFESKKHYGDVLTLSEARSEATSIEELFITRRFKYDKLGDDLDYVTLAGDYPFRYEDNRQNNAFDDLILRVNGDHRRWAYAGRLMGGPVESLYQAMGSLFLHPNSTVMFNSYTESDPTWLRYANVPVARLSALGPVSIRTGERAGLAGWHQQFDPMNHAGLLFVSSSGGSTSFRIDVKGNEGHTSDIPETDPVVVHIVHSFTAERPEDPDTLAGRWMANGAYIYYGSMNEPYLDSFRTHSLVATLLTAHLPMAAAVRKLHVEVLGQPWRLMYFGDPLFRVIPVRPRPLRLSGWDPLSDWPVCNQTPQLGPEAKDSERLDWARNAAIYRLQTAVSLENRPDPGVVLASLDRQSLDANSQRIYDDLMVDTWIQSGRIADMVERMARIVPNERTPVLRRHLETAQVSLLQLAMRERDLERAMALWTEVVRAKGSRDFVRVFTERVGTLTEPGKKLESWRQRLKQAKQAGADPVNHAIIDAELKRIGS